MTAMSEWAAGSSVSRTRLNALRCPAMGALREAALMRSLNAWVVEDFRTSPAPPLLRRLSHKGVGSHNNQFR
ncbi:MAG: hypothetical protein NAOJABEB_02529 [Steroidobacteraceae bacterium]|nr:hypothetical protein [Steroidobacteraceae bacterium]